MTTPTIPNLSPPGSTPWVLARPSWRTAVARAVWRLIDRTGTTVFFITLVLLGLTWIGAGR